MTWSHSIRLQRAISSHLHLLQVVIFFWFVLFSLWNSLTFCDLSRSTDLLSDQRRDRDVPQLFTPPRYGAGSLKLELDENDEIRIRHL